MSDFFSHVRKNLMRIFPHFVKKQKLSYQEIVSCLNYLIRDISLLERRLTALEKAKPKPRSAKRVRK